MTPLARHIMLVLKGSSYWWQERTKPTGYNRTCQHCGEAFETKVRSRMFCSKYCKIEASKKAKA